MTERVTKNLANSPAFPIQNAQYPDAYGGHPGMTLRQHYAGLAMQGIMAAEGEDTVYSLEMVAVRSVALADALLEELEKEQPNG